MRRAAVCALLATSACSLFASLDGLSDVEAPWTSDGSVDAGVPAQVAGERDAGRATRDGDAVEAPDTGASLATPILLARAGAVGSATGLAQQTHLVWAERSARWILFHITDDAPTLLRTRVSADFVTWSDGASLTLPVSHGNDGRAFTVATEALASSDVVHIALSLKEPPRRHFVARAVVTGADITYAAPVQQSFVAADDVALDPDGASIVVGTDGYVTDCSGWTTTNPDGSGGTGNAYCWRSSAADVGGAWSPTWTRSTVQMVEKVTNARATLAMNGGELLAFWEAAEQEPDPLDLRFARGGSTVWTPPAAVFGSPSPYRANDWAVLRVTDGEIHAVRRRNDGVLEHRRFDGNAWASGAAPPAQVTLAGGGLVLTSGPSGPVLAALSGAGGVVTTAWSGAQWSPWSSLVPAHGGRTALAGFSARSGAKTALVWSERDGGITTVHGLRLR